MWNDTIQEVDHRKEATRQTSQVRQSREVWKEIRRSSGDGRCHPSQAAESHTEDNSRKRMRQRQRQSQEKQVSLSKILKQVGRLDRITVRTLK